MKKEVKERKGRKKERVKGKKGEKEEKEKKREKKRGEKEKKKVMRSWEERSRETSWGLEEEFGKYNRRVSPSQNRPRTASVTSYSKYLFLRGIFQTQRFCFQSKELDSQSNFPELLKASEVHNYPQKLKSLLSHLKI